MQDEWNSYLYENSNVLKNKLDIHDKPTLEHMEQEIALKKLTYLILFPMDGKYDLEHLKGIHKFLFDEIYPFAGELRKCSMSKNLYDFTKPVDIKEDFENTLKEFNNGLQSVVTKEQYSFILSPFYYDLIRIHPFREGNGRSIREFVREIVLKNNETLPFKVELDYTKMDRNNLMLGTKQRYLYPSLLETEFNKALVYIDDIKKK